MTAQKSNSINRNKTNNIVVKNTTNNAEKESNTDSQNTTDAIQDYVSGDSARSSSSHRF